MSKSKSITGGIFRKILSDSIVPFVTELGFHKLKCLGSFGRWEGDCLLSLHSGFLQERNRDEGWVYVSMGVGFRSLASFLHAFPDAEAACDPEDPSAMGTDTGHIRGGPPYQAIRWRILPDLSDWEITKIGQEVIEEMEHYAIPFLEKYNTLEKVVAAWEAGVFFNTSYPHADYYLAGAYWLRGERARAIKHIEVRLTHWKAVYDETSRRSTFNQIGGYERFLGFLKNECSV